MEEIPKTLQWVNGLFDFLAPSKFNEEITGDLYELYLKDIQQFGRAAAKRRYVINGLGFLIKSFFWKKSHQTTSLLLLPAMIKNYFKSAIRSLLAHKGTATINVLGLVVAIASTLAILTVIRFE